MFKNYIKTAWRNLMKSKVFSFINILGLTIGITVCMMIYLFIMNEFSFDSFHKKAAQIYVVMRGFENEGKQSRVTYVSGRYGPALLNDFNGQIVQQVRVNQNDNLVTFGNKAFHEKNILDVDSGFFTLFSFLTALHPLHNFQNGMDGRKGSYDDGHKSGDFTGSDGGDPSQNNG